MADADLQGVDPERRQETARRIEVLDRYLAIGLPDAADDSAHAAEVGVGVDQFRRLARVWREHRRPELLPGAKARGSASRRSSGAADGPGASQAANLLVVDEVALDLPVRLPSPRALPILHLAMDGATGDALAWRLEATRVSTGSAAALLLAMRRSGNALGTASLPAGLAEGPLGHALAEAGVRVIARPAGARLGVEARRLMAGQLGRVALRSRAVLRADAGATAHIGRIDLEEAAEVVRAALEPLGRTGNAALSLPEGAAGERLRRALEALAAIGS